MPSVNLPTSLKILSKVKEAILNKLKWNPFIDFLFVIQIYKIFVENRLYF